MDLNIVHKVWHSFGAVRIGHLFWPIIFLADICFGQILEIILAEKNNYT